MYFWCLFIQFQIAGCINVCLSMMFVEYCLNLVILRGPQPVLECLQEGLPHERPHEGGPNCQVITYVGGFGFP